MKAFDLLINYNMYTKEKSIMAEQVLIQFRADKALKQEVTLPENIITKAEAKNAFHELRRQAADVPEMTLDEINAKISAIRKEKNK